MLLLSIPFYWSYKYFGKLIVNFATMASLTLLIRSLDSQRKCPHCQFCGTSLPAPPLPERNHTLKKVGLDHPRVPFSLEPLIIFCNWCLYCFLCKMGNSRKMLSEPFFLSWKIKSWESTELSDFLTTLPTPHIFTCALPWLVPYSLPALCGMMFKPRTIS